MELVEHRSEAWKWKRKQELKVQHTVMSKLLISTYGQSLPEFQA
jgi:hypothetical protein